MNRYTATLIVSVTIGCGAESVSNDWQARRQVSGDTTTVHTVAGQAWASDAEVVDDVVIGVRDGSAAFMFGKVLWLAEDLSGGIYVFDGQGPEIRHFGRAGEFSGTVGRSGQGPGEYGRLTMGMVVDSAGVLYLHDWGNRRVVRFTGGGRALDPWTIDSPFLTTVRGTWIYSDAPGRLLLTTRVGEAPALLVLEDGQVTDTLPVPHLPGMPEQRGGPYSIETYWSWHPDGYFVVGVSNDYSLEARRPDGVLRIRRDVERLPVHPEEADSWRRHFRWMERDPAYRPPEGEAIPATMPPFRGIVVSNDGRIWVRRNTHPIQVPVDEDRPDRPPAVGWEQPFVYDVFEGDGTFLGEVRFPERFEPHLFRAGYVWGVRLGDVDEEYVVRMSLRTGN